MKAKKIIIIISAISFFLNLNTLFAQFASGVMGGAGTGSVEIGGLGNGTEILKANHINFFEAGGFAQTHMLPLYLKPGLLFHYGEGTMDEAPDKKFTMKKIQVPLMLGVKVYKWIVLEAGPTYNYLAGATTQFRSYRKATFGSHGLGYRFGAGMDFHEFFILVNYQNVTYEARGGSNSFREMSRVSFSAGYKFGYEYQGRSVSSRRMLWMSKQE